jgi:hypothetical protein
MDLERLTPVEIAGRRRWWIKFWIVIVLIL